MSTVRNELINILKDSHDRLAFQIDGFKKSHGSLPNAEVLAEFESIIKRISVLSAKLMDREIQAETHPSIGTYQYQSGDEVTFKNRLIKRE